MSHCWCRRQNFTLYATVSRCILKTFHSLRHLWCSCQRPSSHSSLLHQVCVWMWKCPICTNHWFTRNSFWTILDVIDIFLIITHHQCCWTLNNTHSMGPWSRKDPLQPASLPLCGCESVLSVQTVRDEDTTDTGQEPAKIHVFFQARIDTDKTSRYDEWIQG